jgi:hypothetical protein
VASRYGWRAALVFAGVPGLVLAPLVLGLVCDERQSSSMKRRSMRCVLSSLVLNRSYVLLCFAGANALFALNAATAWTPAYLQRAFDISLQTVGLIFGVSVGVLGTLTTWVCGRLADRMYRHGSGGPLLMAAGTMVLYFCLQFASLWTPQSNTAITLLIPGLALGLVWQGPTIALLQGLAAEDERPTAIALFSLIASAFGLGLGPLTVGVVSDAIGHGTAVGLRIGISCSLAASLFGAALLCIAARTIAADLPSANTLSPEHSAN